MRDTGRAPLAFVTGASGFVGAHLVGRLLEGGWRVRALRRRRPIASAGVEEVPGDLRQVDGLAGALEGVDTVFHAGALLDPVDDPVEAERINHESTVALGRFARERGVKSFVFVSSMAALGFRPGAGLLAPEAPCAPTTVYGRTKRAAERSLLAFERSPMRIVIARPPTVYGRGERRNFLALTRAVATGFFPIPGPGDNRLSFCAARNLADALVWLADRGEVSGVQHVADATPVTLRFAVDTIARALGSRALPVPFPLPIARAAAQACEATCRPLGITPPLSRARLVTLTSDCALDTTGLTSRGYEPPVGFEEGVAETVQWYRQQGLVRPARHWGRAC